MGLGRTSPTSSFVFQGLRTPGKRSKRRIGAEADELIAQARAASRQVSVGTVTARLHLDEAHAYLTRALAIDPHNPRSLCHLGNWNFVMGVGGYAPREASFAKGRELIFRHSPRTIDARKFIARSPSSLSTSMMTSTLHFAISGGLSTSTHTTSKRCGYSQLCRKILGHPDDAVVAARSAVTGAPESPSLWNGLGDSLLSAGRYSEAIDALGQAIRL